MRYLLLSAALFICCFIQAQNCPEPGQSPQRAFPICGGSVFKQNSVPICAGSSLPAPSCTGADGAAYGDKNPYWYSFTCFTSGELSFQIDPDNSSDDYDWQLYDVTGHNLGEVYTNPGLVIASNWSQRPGLTGCESAASSSFNCAGLDYPNFSKSPQITEGHKYLLMISHYTDSQIGYELSFTNGTELITDPVKPFMEQASALCTAQTLVIKMNKQIRCTSLAANGSDFTINGSDATITSATGVNCNVTFDFDSVQLQLNKPLPPGDYIIEINKGSDGNTLIDDCENEVSEDNSIPLRILPLEPTPLDSIIPIACAPDVVQLYFARNISCSSIAANGSDFSVTGSDATVHVTSASGNCSSGSSPIVNVKLSKPIQTKGNYIISLKQGTDGNTLFDVCGQQSLPGSLNFSTADTVSAAFTYSVKLGCVYDSILFAHDGRNEVNYWNWMIDGVTVTNAQDSLYTFTDYGIKKLSLDVSNGVCTDSSSVSFNLDNELIARFNTQPLTELCSEDVLVITDSSIGKIISYRWFYGDGTTASGKTPAPKKYQRPPQNTVYPVTLIVQNDINCLDTSIHQIKVLYNCFIAVPTAFTPNNDGLNDYLFPLNAYKAGNLMFRVYNRLGQVVFETRDWTRKWDGTINNQPQPAGTYIWTLSYKNADAGEQVNTKGTTVLIR